MQGCDIMQGTKEITKKGTHYLWIILQRSVFLGHETSRPWALLTQFICIFNYYWKFFSISLLIIYVFFEES